ncbi:hypothetical protein GCM10008909_02920 [Hathewaya limosa]
MPRIIPVIRPTEMAFKSKIKLFIKVLPRAHIFDIMSIDISNKYYRLKLYKSTISIYAI